MAGDDAVAREPQVPVRQRGADTHQCIGAIRDLPLVVRAAAIVQPAQVAECVPALVERVAGVELRVERVHVAAEVVRRKPGAQRAVGTEQPQHEFGEVVAVALAVVGAVHGRIPAPLGRQRRQAGQGVQAPAPADQGVGAREAAVARAPEAGDAAVGSERRIDHRARARHRSDVGGARATVAVDAVDAQRAGELRVRRAR